MNIDMNEANEIYYGEYVSDFKSFIVTLNNEPLYIYVRAQEVDYMNCVAEYVVYNIKDNTITAQNINVMKRFWDCGHEFGLKFYNCNIDNVTFDMNVTAIPYEHKEEENNGGEEL